MISQSCNLGEMSRQQQGQILSDMKAVQGVFRGLSIIDKSGMELVCVKDGGVVDAGELEDKSGSCCFKNPMASGLIYFGSGWIDEVSGEPMMNISVPLVNRYSDAVEGC